MERYVSNEVAQLMAVDLYTKMTEGGIFFIVRDEGNVLRMHIEDPDVGVVVWVWDGTGVPSKLIDDGGVDLVFAVVKNGMCTPYFDIIQAENLEVAFIDVMPNTALGEIGNLNDEKEALEATIDEKDAELASTEDGVSSLQNTIQDIRDALAEFNKAADTFNSTVEEAVNDSYDYL